MKILLLSTLFLCSTIYGQAPENQFQKNGNVPTDQDVYNEGLNDTKFTKAIIIPFELKMYMSSVDKDISNTTGMSFQEISSTMRFRLSNELWKSISTKLPTIALLNVDTINVAKELAYIHSSIGYSYQVLDEDAKSISQPEEQETIENEKPIDKVKSKLTTFGNKVKSKLDKKEEEPTQKSGLQNGQLVTSYDRKERYMNTSIHNVNLLDQINQSYGADVFVFINQMDIGSVYQGQSAAVGKKRVKVHYTIFNLKGEELKSGAAISIFYAKDGDMNAVIQNAFPEISSSIATEIHKRMFSIAK